MNRAGNNSDVDKAYNRIFYQHADLFLVCVRMLTYAHTYMRAMTFLPPHPSLSLSSIVSFLRNSISKCLGEQFKAFFFISSGVFSTMCKAFLCYSVRSTRRDRRRETNNALCSNAFYVPLSSPVVHGVCCDTLRYKVRVCFSKARHCGAA